MVKIKIPLTPAELAALKSLLRHGEESLEFVTTAINLEIARRESRPLRGLRATKILVTPQHEVLEKLNEIEIIASVGASE